MTGHWPEWVADARCAQTDPELFFPEKGGSSKEAKAICARCTVAAECLDYALAYESRGSEVGVPTSYPTGIYGGLSARERRAIRQQLSEEAS